MNDQLLLIVNVGSTSTKVALFRGAQSVVQDTITYSAEELSGYASLADQLPRRKEDLNQFVQKNDIRLTDIGMFISRGGLGKPGPAGAYAIDEAMCEDLLTGKYGRHPSALGPAMMLDLAGKYGRPAIIIDPPSTDEFDPLARISGLPEIERRSAFHALNQKAAARRAADAIGRPYEDLRLVVAHLGGGITIGAHRKGRVVDCTHGLTEGPLTPERAGGLPTQDLVDLTLSGTLDRKQLQLRLVGSGGLAAYLGTTDARQVEAMIQQGDEKALLIYQAMAYQIAKDIGAMRVALKGPADGIVLTGGLAHSEMLTGWIRKWVEDLAPIFIYPGEDEMTAMAEGGMRILSGKEPARRYHSGNII
ncbi:MAG: butyrate kinase [Syntrophus sp. (in: bacteria)]|nr:butyrate kinase [Syntrophus sp. (in: bacteria)]